MEEQIQQNVPISTRPNSDGWAKTLVFVLIGLGIIGALVFVGLQMKNQVSPQPAIVQITPQQTITSPTSPAPTVPTITLKSYTTTKQTELTFPSVTLKYPSDWTFEESDNGKDNLGLTLSKVGYQLTLYQAAMGGGVCLFDDSPAFEGPSSDYRSVKYTQVTANFGVIRYFTSPTNPDNTLFCVKSEDLYASFGPAVIGIKHVGVDDGKVFQEAIDIVKSITIN